MEKRLYPRVIANVPAVVSNQDGDHVDVVVHDISLGGLSFLCNAEQRNLITPAGQFLRHGKPVELQVKLMLPVGEGGDAGEARATVKCAVVYSRRLSVDRCQIGMRFLVLPKECRSQLTRFIDRRMRLISGG